MNSLLYRWSLSLHLTVYFRKQNILLHCSDNPYMYACVCVCVSVLRRRGRTVFYTDEFLRFCLGFSSCLTCKRRDDRMTRCCVLISGYSSLISFPSCCFVCYFLFSARSTTTNSSRKRSPRNVISQVNTFHSMLCVSVLIVVTFIYITSLFPFSFLSRVLLFFFL